MLEINEALLRIAGGAREAANHLLAVVEKSGAGYTARLERFFSHSPQRAWAMLTENGELSRWFPELRVQELREGGALLFDMGDGTFETMDIVALSPGTVLEYTWGADRVRFELRAESGGCGLTFIEQLTAITAHTPKDIAGWHVCLDVIQALLDGKQVEGRKEQWKHWYEQYALLFAPYGSG